MQEQRNEVGNLEQNKELRCESMRTKSGKQCLGYFGAKPVNRWLSGWDYRQEKRIILPENDLCQWIGGWALPLRQLWKV